MGVTSKIEKMAKKKGQEPDLLLLEALNSTKTKAAAAKKLKVSPATIDRYIHVYQIQMHCEYYV